MLVGTVMWRWWIGCKLWWGGGIGHPLYPTPVERKYWHQVWDFCGGKDRGGVKFAQRRLFLHPSYCKCPQSYTQSYTQVDKWYMQNATVTASISIAIPGTESMGTAVTWVYNCLVHGLPPSPPCPRTGRTPHEKEKSFLCELAFGRGGGSERVTFHLSVSWLPCILHGLFLLVFWDLHSYNGKTSQVLLNTSQVFDCRENNFRLKCHTGTAQFNGAFKGEPQQYSTCSA